MYRTKDLSQAAYLVLKGHEVQVSVVGDHCAFDFPPEAEKDALSYNRGASAPARIYAQMIRHLKGMVTNLKHSTAA